VGYGRSKVESGGENRLLYSTPDPQKKENHVPKLKTNRGAAKRFKKTGTGKIKAKRAFARHILTKKSANRKRGLRTPKFVAGTDSKGIKKLIPYI
jgi:large subunit ribosomal protein L35